MEQLQSPLSMVMYNPVLHRFITYLADKKAEQERNPGMHVSIELSRQFITSVRESFRQKILDGERHLHMLAHLLASVLLEGNFELHSNVIGVLPDGNRPFLIRERMNRNTLLSQVDIDLGNHLLSQFRYQQAGSWVPLELSANFIEYLPAAPTSGGVNRLTSRVKAEEEIWNKVADEIFQLDQLVTRDKHLRQYSKFIKDIFGIKVVCNEDATCLKVAERLLGLTLADADGAGDYNDGRHPSERLLDFIETKNYLTCAPAEMKKTGWRALKSVVRWHERLFEIQVQPLNNYHLELDHMAGPSHNSFKLRRDALRAEVTRQLPLYGFYRDLLKMLFMNTNVSFDYENASVVIQ